jgi:hypothetical protein
VKPDAQACLTKVTKSCNKLLAGIGADRTKLTKSITTSCGPPKLAPDDLHALAGVGFGVEEAAFCQLLDVPTLDAVSEVALCVQRLHECRADALLGQQTPRARELLAAVGRNVAVDAPCLPFGADGGGHGLDDPKGAGKATLKCQATLAKVGAKFLGATQKLVQKCAATVAACVQLKPNVMKCSTKSKSTCAKQIGKFTQPGSGVRAKLASALVKGCGAPKLDFAHVLAAVGVGFQAHTAECAALGVPVLASIDDVAECVIDVHACRAEQLLESEIPRLDELVDIGGTPLP